MFFINTISFPIEKENMELSPILVPAIKIF